jgi:hypothetical protein
MVSGRASEPSGGRLPDFLGVGPPRTATSWLDAVLRGHVGLPREVKEVDFFVENYARGIEWYKSYFRDCDANLPIGEICPSYYSSIGRERIALHIPRCRIICTFRDPVERRYSFYKLALRNAWTVDDFETWVAKNPVYNDSGLKPWFETFATTTSRPTRRAISIAFATSSELRTSQLPGHRLPTAVSIPSPRRREISGLRAARASCVTGSNREKPTAQSICSDAPVFGATASPVVKNSGL